MFALSSVLFFLHVNYENKNGLLGNKFLSATCFRIGSLCGLDLAWNDLKVNGTKRYVINTSLVYFCVRGLIGGRVLGKVGKAAD